ncbi:MAG: helix-turn-helix transcriptional regulator [Alicyclobacillus sp.]|nr:helix-turn-helix transcriptional regulator [Alicyclobacillus sp.]
MKSSFGERVRRLRLERNWSQQEMSLHCNISAPHLSSIERGKRFPSLDYALRIATALGVTLQALCDETAELQMPRLRRSADELPLYLHNFVLNEASTPYLQAAHRLSTLPEEEARMFTTMIELYVQQHKFHPET